MGKWNGYGGGIDDGESIEESAVRELLEESGVVVQHSALRKIAIVNFHNIKRDGTTFLLRMHAFEIWEWQGEPHESEEMSTPTWFLLSELAQQEMMPADSVWLPRALSGENILASAYYMPFQQELIGEVAIEIVDEFPVN